jgi:hypothetical protein
LQTNQELARRKEAGKRNGQQRFFGQIRRATKMERRKLLWTILSGCFLCLAAPLAASTATTSPNISGDWSGTGSATGYNADLGVKYKFTCTAVITQTGNALAVSVVGVVPGTIQTDAASPAAEISTFKLDFSGSAGNGVYFAAGTTVESFVAGSFNSQGNKIKGVFGYSASGWIVNGSYSISKVTTPGEAQIPKVTELRPAKNFTGSATYSVIGMASGKTYTFGTNSKAQSFSGAVTGTIAFGENTANLTFNNSTPQTFNNITVSTIQNFSFYMGQGENSNSLFILLKYTKTGSAGKGWIYDSTGVSSFAISLKPQ